MARTQFGSSGRGCGGSGMNSAYVNPQNTSSGGLLGTNSSKRSTENFNHVEQNSNPQVGYPNLGDELCVGDATVRDAGSVHASIDTTRIPSINIGTATALAPSGARLKKFGIISGRYVHFNQTLYEVPSDKEEVYITIFDAVAADRYRSILYETRRESMNEVGTTSIVDCFDKAPSWMHDSIWENLVLLWSREEWQNKSSKGLANRLTEKDGSITKHTVGSVSFAEHKIVMTKELGKEPTHAQLFNHVHKRKRGQQDYVDNKSKRGATEYEKSIVIKCGSALAASQLDFDEESWLEVIGGPKKGRVYGLGTVESSTGPTRGTLLFTQAEVEEVVATRVMETESRLRSDLESSLRAEIELQWEAKFEAAFARLGSQGRISVTHQQ